MKGILISILAALIAFTGRPLCAQNIPASAEKVNVKGKIMYAHKVKKGETLYSLGKMYGIEIAEIQKQNPQVSAGLKAGMLLYIPADGPEDNGSSGNRTAQENSGRQLSGETRSARTQERNRQNPGRDTAVSDNADGDISGSRDADGENIRKYKRHTVRWYETLTDIARFYNVPEEAIMALNKLTDAKVKKRQVLFIPDREYVAEYQKNKETENQDAIAGNRQEAIVPGAAAGTEDGKEPLSGTQGEQASDPRLFPGRYPSDSSGFAPLEKNYSQPGPFRIGMILPLNSRYPDGASANFMDFYAGALLAVKAMKEKGMDMEINIYDQSDYPSVEKLMEKGRLENNQMLIGPVHSRDLKQIAGFSRQENIPVISPMDPAAETLLSGNSSIIQAPPSPYRQMENLIELMKKDLYKTRSQQVLLIYEKSGEDTALVKIAEDLLSKNFISYSTLSYGILEGRNIYGTLLRQLDQSGSDTLNTVVLVPSNSEAFVSDVVRNLGLTIKENRTIRLYGMPKWRNFETIDPELFHRMNLCLSVPYFVDYSSGPVKEFLLRYRALYNTEPTPYAFQGYDIAYYFLSNLLKHGSSLFYQQKMPEGRLLQADFVFFRETPGEGFENIATRNIRYNPDYSVTLLEN